MKKIKEWLIVKIATLKEENKHLKKLLEMKPKDKEYIDEISLLKSELRKLRLENERLNSEKK